MLSQHARWLRVGALCVLLTLCVLPSFADTGQGDWWMFHHDRQHTGCSPFTISAGSPAAKWAFLSADWVVSSPTFGAAHDFYVGSYDANLYALNPDGTVQWAFPTGSLISLRPGHRDRRHHLCWV